MKKYGLSFILLIIAVVIIGQSVNSVRTLYEEREKHQQVRKTLRKLQKTFYKRFYNELAWQNTVADSVNNPGLTCLKEKRVCAMDVPHLLVWRNHENKIVYDSKQKGIGFTHDGKSCQTFDVLNGNDDCPISYELTWQFLCEGGYSCLNPNIRLRAKAMFKNTTSQEWLLLDRARYSIDTILGRSVLLENFAVKEWPRLVKCHEQREFRYNQDVWQNMMVEKGLVLVKRTGTYSCRLEGLAQADNFEVLLQPPKKKFLALKTMFFDQSYQFTFFVGEVDTQLLVRKPCELDESVLLDLQCTKLY